MADFYAARAGTNAGAPLDGFLTAVHTARRSWSGLRSRAGSGSLAARGSEPVLEAPALVAGLDDVAVMGQPVEERRGHFGVAED